MHRIYIAEAHASDEWPIRLEKSLQCKQHKTIEDRIEAMEYFINMFDYEIPCVADTIKDTFEKIYSAWPAFCMLVNNHNKTVEWQLTPKKPGYLDFGDIGDILEKYDASI